MRSPRKGSNIRKKKKVSIEDVRDMVRRAMAVSRMAWQDPDPN